MDKITPIKLLTIVGARPQFIKAAALSKAILQYPNITEIIVHTGQHFDANMSEVFFDEMEIPKPNYQLDIHSLTHGAMTGRMLEKMEEIMLKEKPDYVIVYGDTNSTLAGALAARKQNIKLVHIEAGLRSFNMQMPEEINRILTDRISDLLFCPTQQSVLNLQKEGFDNFNSRYFQVGDIMYDSMLLFAEKANDKAKIGSELNGKKFALCTIHRAENTDQQTNLENIFKALNKIAEDVTIVLPLHPRTKQKLGSMVISSNIFILEPLGYFDMLYLLKNCTCVLTDSGGLQKEAYFNQKYCITLREETEWVELLENGWNTLAGSNTNAIIEAYSNSKNNILPKNNNLYGNGKTAHKILETILKESKL